MSESEKKQEIGAVGSESSARLGPENPFETAAKIIRYYLKHQNYPSAWERMGEYEKGVAVACENLERLMLEEAKKLNKIGGA